MPANIFKFLSEKKPFPYNENKFRKELTEKINDKINYIKDDATESVKTTLCSIAGVADEDELIEYLEDVLAKLEDGNFIKKEAEDHFNNLYGQFLRQLPSLIEDGCLYEKDFEDLLKNLKIDKTIALEVINYKKNELPNFKHCKERKEQIAAQQKILMQDSDYKNIKAFLNRGSKPTFELLCDFFGVASIKNAQHLLELINKKTLTVDAKLDASSDLVLYNILKKYANDVDFNILVESLYLKDCIELFEAKWKKISSDKKIVPEELESVYKDGIAAGFKPSVITKYLEYIAGVDDVLLFIPTQIKEARDTKYRCHYCGNEYYRALSKCDVCKQHLNDAKYLVDRLSSFSQTIAPYKVLKRQYKELMDSFKDIRKFASKNVNQIIKQNEAFLKRSNKKKRKTIAIISIILVCLTLGAGAIYILSYLPFVNDQEVNTYHLKTKNDFLDLVNNKKLNDIYILDNDINFYGDELPTIGTPENPFTGEFYGNGHVLSNFTLKSDKGAAALFMYNEGSIERLGIEKITISAPFHTAGFVYYNSGKIDSCYVKDFELSSTLNYSYASGFVSTNEGDISNCYAYVQNISATYGLAGFVVENSETGRIKDSFVGVVDINVEDDTGIGAFCVSNLGQLDNVHTTLPDIVTNFDYNYMDINYITLETVESLDFYENTLMWSKKIWDFSKEIPTLIGEQL